MLFWLICAVLTVVATMVVLRPLLSPARTDASLSPDMQVYKDQLAEVERDIDRGLLTGEEAKAARIEVSRRILAAAPDKDAVAPAAGREPSAFSNLVFYLVAALIITSSVGGYLLRGSPGYGGLPFEQRASKPRKDLKPQELIARVEARLRESPEDGQGWDVLAPVYLKLRRHRDAIRAYSRAIELLGDNRARLRGLAEAYLAASNGFVGPEVRAAYTKILAKEPKLIAPRFWLAVGLEQDGDHEAAKAAYQAILAGDNARQIPPTLKQLINQRLAVVSGEKPRPNSPTTNTGKGPAPPAGMAKGMSAKEQSAMIEQMVSGLAERLDTNGGSSAEWQRLIRAYWVLGRRDAATEALGKAKAAAANASGVKQLDEFAKALGMKAN